MTEKGYYYGKIMWVLHDKKLLRTEILPRK